ncbi:MAG: LURP-one-related family protein [Promethearchaeota archaeon]
MSNTIHCPQCGAIAKQGQKFCENCGAEIQTRDVTVDKQNSTINAGLFDPSHMNYVLQEKYWDFGSGPIFDTHGNQIGKMKRKLFSLRAKIELMEMNGRVAASISRKIVAIKPSYDLKDENDVLIGRFQKTLLSVFRPKFELKDPNGNILFTAYGKFMGFDFEIYKGTNNNKQNLIAEIHKTDRWRDVFFGGLIDFKDTYAIRIHDKNVDRRLLLGFVITIDNVLHDT